MGDTIRVAVRDQQLLAYYDDAKRVTKATPHSQSLAIERKDLDAMITPVGNIDPVLSVDRDSVGGREFPLGLAAFSPFGHYLAFRRQLNDPRVACIGDHDFTSRGEN